MEELTKQKVKIIIEDLMEENVKRHVRIFVPTDEERNRIGSKIHEQLIGNQDYIDNKIVLNIDLKGAEGYEVNLYIFKDSKTLPDLILI